MDENSYPNYLPSWGRLPVEQYLIRHWNYSSSESVNAQRQRLVHEYMQLDEIPEEWDPISVGGSVSHQPKRIPTAEELEVILRPWRSYDMRKRAWEIWCGGKRNPPVMLRTYYDNGEEGDAKFTAWAALNEAELFNFGADWRRIFGILPELAGCRDDGQRGPLQEIIDQCLPEVKDSIEQAKQANPGWLQDPDEAFEEDRLLVVYLDAKQNVTVHGRLEIDQGEVDALLLSWELGAPPGRVIEEGEVGEKYLLSNEAGRKFFGLSDSDLVDKSSVS
ncbi:hypothetical protein BJY00DRAFT_305013 [Aspergillus carlsbadensis]|nr:hypothetical protein BJY00DRAFT_305013 [Aspergillus carlsbadensis]